MAKRRRLLRQRQHRPRPGRGDKRLRSFSYDIAKERIGAYVFVRWVRVKMSRVVSWYSCGAASAIATKLTLKDAPAAEVVYCETGGEHSDNERFLTDCEIWFGKSITRLRSAKYASTWDVWEDRSYLAGISGAPCTSELKVAPRLAWQRQDDVHVFGYTADKPDIIRANRLQAWKAKNYGDVLAGLKLLGV